MEDQGGLPVLRPEAAAGVRDHTVGAPPTGPSTAQIVDLLANVPILWEARARAVLAHYISEAVGAALLPPDVPHPKIALYHLVAACHDLEDGLPALVDGVEFLAGPIRQVARLRRLVSPVRDHLLPASEAQLEDLLVGLRVPSMARLYHAATGNGIAALPYPLTDAWDAFTALLDHNTAPDRPSPHMTFIAMLLEATHSDQVSNGGPEMAGRFKQLREWLAIQIERLRAEGAVTQANQLDRIRDRSEALTPHADKPIYLIIQLEPITDLVDGQVMCRLSHWRQVHPLEWRPEPGDDRVVPLDELPDHVGRLVREAESGWAYQLDDYLVLEFVLPLDLLGLGLGLAEWTRDMPDAPYPASLGTEYEIHIRSQERLRDLPLHRAWRRRWQVLVEALDCTTYWAAEEDASHPYSMGDRIMAERDVVACVLSGPPDSEPGRSQLWMALRAGVPVVLWQAEDPPPQIREEVRRIVGRRDIRDLPGAIKRLRARAPRDHANKCPSEMRVALMWDDPNRFLDAGSPLRAPGA